jgi:hypothetical protein
MKRSQPQYVCDAVMLSAALEKKKMLQNAASSHNKQHQALTSFASRVGVAA